MVAAEFTNYQRRADDAGAIFDSSCWSLIGSGRGSLRHILNDAMFGAFFGKAGESDGHSVNKTAAPLPLRTQETFVPQSPYLREGEVDPPLFFTDKDVNYAGMTSEMRSQAMQGNIALSVDTVLWTSAARAHYWPTMVDSGELIIYLYSELQELHNLDNKPGHNGEYSLLADLLHHPVEGEWYRDARAKDIWDAAGEVADMAICTIQHWLIYDSMTISECVAAARRLVSTFDEAYDILPGNKADTLLHILKMYSKPDSRMVDRMNDLGDVEPVQVADVPELIKPTWPELFLGIAHMLSKQIGFDLWEAITLKAFTNERHYPTELLLVENYGEGNQEGSLPIVDGYPVRRMNEPRSYAWKFAKGRRQDHDHENRTIPPMSDHLIRETVLDWVYGSPYVDGMFDWDTLLTLDAKSGRFVIPVILAEAGAWDREASAHYYPFGDDMGEPQGEKSHNSGH